MSRAQQMLTCVAIAGSALGLSSCSASNPDESGLAEATPGVVAVEEQTPSPTPTVEVEDEVEDQLYRTGEGTEIEIDGVSKSITDPDSLWVIVNKHNPLPASYAPTDLVTPNMPRKGEHQELRAEAAKALMAMSKAADHEVGKPLQLVSGYRSYTDQKEVYDRYVAKDGQAAADTYSARAGFSEHQTGLVADLSTVAGKMEKFGDTKLGEWTAKNAWKFGFILRYTPENQSVAGYQSEPWHFRYVGIELAKYYHDNEIASLEQLFNQPAAPDYK